jgi:hypothetical protein
MDKIEFRVQPTPEFDDHQVRILVNGIDIIPDKMFGLDPVQSVENEPALLEQEALTKSGELTYARWSWQSGEIAYDTFEVIRTDQTVIWTRDSMKGPSFTFAVNQYEEAIAQFRTDYSWETPKRTVERLIGDLDYSALKRYGMSFSWVSARAYNTDKIMVVFRLTEADGVSYGITCYLIWDQTNADEAARSMKHLLQQSPQLWPEVAYCGQAPPQ